MWKSWRIFTVNLSYIPCMMKQLAAAIALLFFTSVANAQPDKWKAGFQHPPDVCKPGVYWYFMDGNMNAESIKADLESMKRAGISNLVFLEVNVGVPRGPVDFLGQKWDSLFVFAEKEARRLGIEVTLGIGPGWTGSGGPWVAGNESMKHLVASADTVRGGDTAKIILKKPSPKTPFFGVDDLPADFKKKWQEYYEDVAVLAFRLNKKSSAVSDVDHKALYYRGPYNSGVVAPYLPSPATGLSKPGEAVNKDSVLDLTGKMSETGVLEWSPPAGDWVIMRFGSRNNGAITRPAPVPGLGFESDKFDSVALDHHLQAYVGVLLNRIGPPDPDTKGGVKLLHLDSWEMGAQNWTAGFRQEFIRRRGYDPLPWYPVYSGVVVNSPAESERFLWDLRQTTMELIIEEHAGYVKSYGRKHGLALSIEPYDMNPTADLELGSVADVPMAEFWTKGYGFNSAYSVIEATSIGHVLGKNLIPAEAFTAADEGWRMYPGSMKNQGDWAFASGINRFVYHTFQNQFLPDSLKPGATMAQFSVHWDRSQTWWPMVGAYHDYIARCSYLLQQGRTVADILYLTPEGAPHVFVPPTSAIRGDTLGDRRGYNFDGCSPGQLALASVRDHRIVFPGGASYRLLVLPAVETMTPELLQRVAALIMQGAIAAGGPPLRSPSLSGYPACDSEVTAMANRIWGPEPAPAAITRRLYGEGIIFRGGVIATDTDHLYPSYAATSAILRSINVEEDFVSDSTIRYTHRIDGGTEIYFVANTTNRLVSARSRFRSTQGSPEWWNPVTGKTRPVREFHIDSGFTFMPLNLHPYESAFILFSKGNKWLPGGTPVTKSKKTVVSLNNWRVHFDPRRGGPENARFDSLTDWSKNENDGIKYYSGIAVYSKTFDLEAAFRGNPHPVITVDLGQVHNLAHVFLNGKDLGILWTAPWQLDLSAVVKPRGNELRIEVANLWINRLIGDEKKPDDGIKDDHWPDWFLTGKPRSSGRFTFSTTRQYTASSPLVPSGLTGPVQIIY